MAGRTDEVTASFVWIQLLGACWNLELETRDGDSHPPEYIIPLKGIHPTVDVFPFLLHLDIKLWPT